jgi:hypothetical protein
MRLTRRNPKPPHRARRSVFLVEQLEKRDLPSSTHQPITDPHNQNTGLSALSASPPADLPFSVQGLPNGFAGPTGGNASGRSWQSVSQTASGLFGPGLPQKAPADAKGPLVQVPLMVGFNQSSSPNGEGYTPAQLRQAYGFNQVSLPAGQTFNDAGSGQTIAIIDPLDDPYIRSDVQAFDTAFNIGGAARDSTNTSFLKVVNENGGATLPDTDNFNLGVEASLDVEWAHAMAPGANILLLETNTGFSLNDIGTAIETATHTPGVSIISMSLGFGDEPTEYFLDSMFTTPAGHQGISFVASAGDSGSYFAEYPAASPNVLSVGGTTLPADQAGNPNRTLEYAWTYGGGGISSTEAEPRYQVGVQSTGMRTGPDLAYDADLNTGFAVYDTLYANAFFPGKPWLEVGGTSAGAPQISSLLAITDQLRVAAHEGTFDGPRQLLPAIYQIAATDPNAFHDITTGNDGHPAGPGYDFATGFGTPNAKYLVPDLVAAYTTSPISRTVYWTGDVSTDWDTPGNWSTVDPLVKNLQQSVLPSASDRVVVDLTGATILHDRANYDTISSFTVTATKVRLDIGAGTLDLAGASPRGTFRVDQNGDTVTMEAGILANAVVTSGTSLSTTTDANGVYPLLNAVQMDGTVNANQSGRDNGFVFENGLVLNGTVNLGGNKDLSSVIGAGYWDPNYGNQDNNLEAITGTGTIRLGQSQTGDGLQTWGTFASFTIGPNITILGGGPGSIGILEQTVNTGGFDFQGTIKANGGILVIQSYGPALFDVSTATEGWTNEGTITASGGATLGLLGNWINSGKISVDAHSTILLGDGTGGELPTDFSAAFDVWSSTGAVTIADGATVYVGGFLTVDQYQGAVPIPGVTWHPAADARTLVGALDNSPAANPVSHGVLNVVGTPLTIAGGTILGGAVSAASKLQVSAAAPLPGIDFVGFQVFYSTTGGWLDNVTNGGTVNVAGVNLALANATNNGTVTGSGGDVIEFLGTWADPGTIKVDGTSSLYLGAPLASNPSSPPTLADGSPYAWNLNKVGSIQVADGATVGFGGLLTADQFTLLPTLPGVNIHMAHDTILLYGWLDNKPADNPITGGVLALTSATGAVNLANGLVSGGAITNTGTGALNVVNPGTGPSTFFGNILDGVTNNGTITVTSTFLFLEGAVVNNGKLTASGYGAIGGLSGASLTNNGSFTLVNGTASLGMATNTGIISVSPGSFGSTVMVNSGTVAASAHGEIGFSVYDNSHGILTVDSTSFLGLGRSTLSQSNFPTIADGIPYAFDASKVGTIQIADGAQIQLGGLMTTDQLLAFPSLPGVSVHFGKVQLILMGWLDNSPADNPKSGGVLAINAATGPVFLVGGYIYHGKITTSGSNDLESSYVGVLDNVELDGNLNVTGPFGFASMYIEDNLTLNGSVVMPQGVGRLYVGFFDNTVDTISGTGTISLGTAQTYEGDMVNLSDGGLTIGPGITIDAGALSVDIASEGSQINVLGTVKDDTAMSTLYTYGINPNTGQVFQDLANFNGGTLTGGTWEFSNGASWHTDGVDITTNAANLSISGAGTKILDAIFGPSNDALASLTTNAATGHFTVGAGYEFAQQGSFLNAGTLEIDGAVSVQGNYMQTSGADLDINIAGPSAYGALAVGGTANLAGTLNVALLNGFTPAPGSSFAILTFGSRSGDFGAENGLMFGPGEFFTPEYLGNTLTLVVGP